MLLCPIVNKEKVKLEIKLLKKNQGGIEKRRRAFNTEFFHCKF